MLQEVFKAKAEHVLNAAGDPWGRRRRQGGGAVSPTSGSREEPWWELRSKAPATFCDLAV